MRGYCLDSSTYRLNYYNVMSEDPFCSRPYPDSIPSDNSVTAKDGECVRFDDVYVKLTILPNDGRAWDYKTEWDSLVFKQEPVGMFSMADFKMKFEGDGYSMEINTDTSKGYM